MKKVEDFYKEKINKSEKEINELSKRISYMGWGRLIILIGGLTLSYKLYKDMGFFNGVAALVVTGLLFFIVALMHGRIMVKKENLEVVVEFNEKGLKRLNGEYREFKDKGNELLEEGHPFAEDLDIFGQNSLFQMINTTRTLSGRRKLGEIISLKKLPTKNQILEKQQAIKELGDKIEWREQQYVNGTFKKKKGEELEELIKWSTEVAASDISRIIVSCIFIAITMAMIFLAITKYIPISFLILDLMANFAVIKILTKDRGQVIELFHSIKDSVKAYSKLLTLIEEEEFQSPYLKTLKNKLKDNSDISCKDEMKRLVQLLDWVGDSAGNAYFFILNVIAFADIFILFNLNKWRDANGEKIEKWLQVMGEFDALSSISNLSFEHKEWCYGEITEETKVKGTSVSHPLIGGRAIDNSYELVGPKQITLITGSNMSGKSTFLRTIGINIVLSYIGAPCCAKTFSCSIMNIYTCMRTKDNLEESISSFYAEILRIKLIIEASRRGEKLFFLLDEIFKGTNSKDRHTGATVLVKQLVESGAVGLLSTHDLELCNLEETMKEVDNYNFREYYENNKIKFDYKLRKGKSTTQNAVYLMKLAGIDI